MTAPPSTVLVTGASGFLGRACCRVLTARGFRVRALVRRPGDHAALAADAAGGVFAADLPDAIDERAFADGPQAIVHCAYAMTPRDVRRARAINVEGSERLLALARGAGVAQYVFVSSITASPHAASFYARSKFEVESLHDATRDLILRPGLVIGPGGLFARVADAIRRRPLVPLFYGGRQEFQIVWIDDVCDAIVRALDRRLTGVVAVAAPDAVAIRRFYREIGRLLGRECVFVRLPGGPMVVVLRAAERLGLALPISSENVLGLKRLRTIDVSADLARLDLMPRSFARCLELMRPE